METYYCCGVIQVNVTCRHPSDILDKARQLPSLDEAETSEQYDVKLAEIARTEAVKKKEAEEEAARHAEEDRKARIQAEYLAAIPDEIKVWKMSVIIVIMTSL